MRLFVGVLCLCVCLGVRADLFDGVWRTYSQAINGDAPALPLTVADAIAQGWVVSSEFCESNLGFEYFYKKAEPGKKSPLSIWYTASGNISGVSIYVFGQNAAPTTLIDLGYWRPATKFSSKNDTFYLSVGFRDGPVCDATYSPTSSVGDKVIINPDTALSLSLPLNESDVYCGGWVQGSAMKCFGTHYFYHLDQDDLWNPSKLTPVGVMYWKGQLTTFMIVTPVAQPGGLPPGDGDWDQPPLIPTLMCQNWCDDGCGWTNTWSTIHIFLSSAWQYILPDPNEGPPVYRSCVNADYSCSA